MKLLFAPDSFKGSLSSNQAISLLTEAARRHFPGCEIIGVPMADGGEGTAEALLSTLGGTFINCTVTGPLGEPVTAKYGITQNHMAIIEMAEASGLPLVPPKKRNPLLTGTYGTGQLICHVFDQGITDLLLTIGGSATNDGGIGAATALGFRFLDKNDQELAPIGQSLSRIHRIDTSLVHPKLREASITIMCDVENPLTGPNGATYIYGPQKGGNPQILDQLEHGMIHYAAIIQEMTGIDYTSMEGAGAAGGFSIPFLAFANASLSSGIDTVLKAVHFDELLSGVDFVITGEGRVDRQSVFGKVMSGVGKACKKKNIPIAAIVGSMGDGAADIYSCGIDSIMPIVSAPMELSYAMENSETLFADAADRIFRFLKMGIKL